MTKLLKPIEQSSNTIRMIRSGRRPDRRYGARLPSGQRSQIHYQKAPVVILPRPYEFWGFTSRDRERTYRVLVALKEDAEYRQLLLQRQIVVLTVKGIMLKKEIRQLEGAIREPAI